jgi:hypothetical protein
LPNALVIKHEVSYREVSLKDYRKHRNLVVNSLRNGDNIYIHCATGVTRGPAAGAIWAATVTPWSVEGAHAIISEVRNINDNSWELIADEDQKGCGTWATEAKKKAVLWPPREMWGISFNFAPSSVIHATHTDDEWPSKKRTPLCQHKRGATSRCSTQLIDIANLKDAIKHHGGHHVCRACMLVMPASEVVEVFRHYGVDECQLRRTKKHGIYNTIEAGTGRSIDTIALDLY